MNQLLHTGPSHIQLSAQNRATRLALLIHVFIMSLLFCSQMGEWHKETPVVTERSGVVELFSLPRLSCTGDIENGREGAVEKISVTSAYYNMNGSTYDVKRSRVHVRVGSL